MSDTVAKVKTVSDPAAFSPRCATPLPEGLQRPHRPRNARPPASQGRARSLALPGS